MLIVKYTNAYKKSYKRMKKRGLKLDLLDEVVSGSHSDLLDMFLFTYNACADTKGCNKTAPFYENSGFYFVTAPFCSSSRYVFVYFYNMLLIVSHISSRYNNLR